KVGEYDYVEPSISYNNATVTESDVSITPNQNWIDDFEKEVLEELNSKENYKALENDYLSEYLKDQEEEYY
ncbi:MAG: hypothetical protein ACKO96_48580, partial [Flammeovirgaceae bacterium]